MGLGGGLRIHRLRRGLGSGKGLKGSRKVAWGLKGLGIQGVTITSSFRRLWKGA